MKKLIFTCIVLFGASILGASGQDKTYEFRFNGPQSTKDSLMKCNPFKDFPKNFGNNDDWKVSHGTPSASKKFDFDFNYDLLTLAGSRGYISEGLFINYNFKANHKYEVCFYVKHKNGSKLAMEVWAANNISELHCWNPCGEAHPQGSYSFEMIYVSREIPTTSMDGLYKIIGAFDQTDNEYKYFKPTKNFNQLWFYSLYVGGSSERGEFNILRITIIDKGEDIIPDKTPPTTPTNLRVSSNNSYYAQDKAEVSLAWNASTDNVGVKEYEIYLNDQLYTKTTETKFKFSFLHRCSTYTFSVCAVDLSNNKSNKISIPFQTDKGVPSNLVISNDIHKTSYCIPKHLYTPIASESIRFGPGFHVNASEFGCIVYYIFEDERDQTQFKDAPFVARIESPGCPSVVRSATYSQSEPSSQTYIPVYLPDPECTKIQISASGKRDTLMEPDCPFILRYIPSLEIAENDQTPVVLLSNTSSSITSPFQENDTDVILYPNPVTDYLYIKTEITTFTKIEVTDLQGKVLFTSPMPENKMLDFTKYASGIYIVRLFDLSQTVKQFKIIKQ